ncbi:dermonecrotic toxin domain-containing protein [Burkholderia sp. AW49-1]
MDLTEFSTVSLPDFYGGGDVGENDSESKIGRKISKISGADGALVEDKRMISIGRRVEGGHLLNLSNEIGEKSNLHSDDGQSSSCDSRSDTKNRDRMTNDVKKRARLREDIVSGGIFSLSSKSESSIQSKMHRDLDADTSFIGGAGISLPPEQTPIDMRERKVDLLMQLKEAVDEGSDPDGSLGNGQLHDYDSMLAILRKAKVGNSASFDNIYVYPHLDSPLGKAYAIAAKNTFNPIPRGLVDDSDELVDNGKLYYSVVSKLNKSARTITAVMDQFGEAIFPGGKIRMDLMLRYYDIIPSSRLNSKLIDNVQTVIDVLEEKRDQLRQSLSERIASAPGLEIGLFNGNGGIGDGNNLSVKVNEDLNSFANSRRSDLVTPESDFANGMKRWLRKQNITVDPRDIDLVSIDYQPSGRGDGKNHAVVRQCIPLLEAVLQNWRDPSESALDKWLGADRYFSVPPNIEFVSKLESRHGEFDLAQYSSSQSFTGIFKRGIPQKYDSSSQLIVTTHSLEGEIKSEVGGVADKIASYWSKNEDNYRDLSKISMVKASELQVAEASLTQEDRNLIWRAAGLDPTKTWDELTVDHIRHRMLPANDVEVAPLKIYRYTSTDLRVISDKENGRTLLYVPGNSSPIHAFSSMSDMQEWFATEMKSPEKRIAISRYFCREDRETGLWHQGVNDALMGISKYPETHFLSFDRDGFTASGKWKPSDYVLKGDKIGIDIFVDMATRQKERGLDDVANIPSNANVLAHEAVNLLEDVASQLGPIALMYPEVAVLGYAMLGIAQIGMGAYDAFQEGEKVQADGLSRIAFGVFNAAPILAKSIPHLNVVLENEMPHKNYQNVGANMHDSENSVSREPGDMSENASSSHHPAGWLSSYSVENVQSPTVIPRNGVFTKSGTPYQGGEGPSYIRGNDGKVYEVKNVRSPQHSGTGYHSVDVVDPNNPDGPSKAKLYKSDDSSHWRTGEEVGLMGGGGKAAGTKRLELPKESEIKWPEDTQALLTDKFWNDRLGKEYPKYATMAKFWEGYFPKDVKAAGRELTEVVRMADETLTKIASAGAEVGPEYRPLVVCRGMKRIDALKLAKWNLKRAESENFIRNWKPDPTSEKTAAAQFREALAQQQASREDQEPVIMPIMKHLGDIGQASNYAKGPDEVVVKIVLKPGAERVMFDPTYMAIGSSGKGGRGIALSKGGLSYFPRATGGEGEAGGYIGIKSEEKGPFSLSLGGDAQRKKPNEASSTLFQLFVDRVEEM